MYWRKSEKTSACFWKFCTKKFRICTKNKKMSAWTFHQNRMSGRKHVEALVKSISADTWNLFRLLWGKNITECDKADETADYNQENGIDFVAVGGDECSGKK